MALNRHRAAAIHLLASVVVLGSVLATMLVLWYPGAWFESMGGNNLVLILATVDITIGPLLTLIVFTPGKKTLKFDLSVIACLQIIAFLFGLHVLYEARPAFMVFLADQFRAVTAAELEPKLLAQARYPAFQRIPFTGPEVATAEKPTDKRILAELLLAAQAGVDLHLLPQYWVPYDAQRALRSASSLKVLREIAPANGSVLDTFLSKQNRNEDSLRYLPLRTRNKEMATLLDAQSGEVIGIIDAKPWR